MKKAFVILGMAALLSGCFTYLRDELPDMKAKIAAKYKVISVEDWYGGRKIEFDFKGYNAWVVCPAEGVKIAEGKPWTWTMQWRTAFVPRTGAPEMLKRGWHHAAIDTFKDRMDEQGLKINHEFQQFLVEELGLKPRAALIGMSWGGFFSIRYAAAYPECVSSIYLDAPLLNFAALNVKGWTPTQAAKNIGTWAENAPKDFTEDPRMPINLAGKIAAAKIPVLLLYGGQDQTVNPKLSAELFARRLQAAGGNLINGIDDAEGRGREAYGHHPHGLEPECQTKLADFFKQGL